MQAAQEAPAAAGGDAVMADAEAAPVPAASDAENRSGNAAAAGTAADAGDKPAAAPAAAAGGEAAPEGPPAKKATKVSQQKYNNVKVGRAVVACCGRVLWSSLLWRFCTSFRGGRRRPLCGGIRRKTAGPLRHLPQLRTTHPPPTHAVPIARRTCL